MMTLGIQKNKKALSSGVILPLLRKEKPLIKYNKNIKTTPKDGRLHRIYSLTQYGVKAIAEFMQCEEASLLYPVKDMQFTMDYFHRCDYISFYITFDKFFSSEHNDFHIAQVYHYFDRGRLKIQIDGKNYPPTSIFYNKTDFIGKEQKQKIEADGIYILDDYKDKKIFVVEVHRSTNTKEILKQLNNHIEAMTQGATGERFNMQKGNFLLSVYSARNVLNNVINRIQELPDFQAFSQLFLFACIEDLQEDFMNAWIYGNRGKALIFQEM